MQLLHFSSLSFFLFKPEKLTCFATKFLQVESRVCSISSLLFSLFLQLFIHTDAFTGMLHSQHCKQLILNIKIFNETKDIALFPNFTIIIYFLNTRNKYINLKQLLVFIKIHTFIIYFSLNYVHSCVCNNY